MCPFFSSSRACAGELVSGRDDARAKRKALIKTVERQIDSVEKLVKKFDALKKAQQAATTTAAAAQPIA